MAIKGPDKFEHSQAKLPGVNIHYVRKGSGPPLLLLHGHPGFWWEWYKCFDELAKNFDVIAVDLRGMGDSEKPDLTDLSKYHLDAVTDDQANLLKHLGIERAYVVGHDYSALVMHKFVRKYRHLTIKGMTMNPIVPGWENHYMNAAHFPESWYAQFHQLPMAVKLVSSSREACLTYYGHFLSHWSANKNLFTEEELDLYVDNYMKPQNIQGAFNYYRANLSVTSRVWTALDQTISDCPMTFLQGMGDTVCPPEWANLVALWYNNYTIEYVPDCGHWPQFELPELITDRIRKAFLTP